MKKLKKSSIILLPALLIMPSHASAYNWVGEAKVTSIEVTYMPQSIPFYVDQAVGGCAAGAPLTWSLRGSTADEKNQNAQAVLSVLMTAKTSGQKVLVYVIADGCKVDYIYIR